jgi:hypothetical protein
LYFYTNDSVEVIEKHFISGSLPFLAWTSLWEMPVPSPFKA